MTARNPFPMPLLMDAEEAARRTLAGIAAAGPHRLSAAASIGRRGWWAPCRPGCGRRCFQPAAGEGRRAPRAGLSRRRRLARLASRFSPSTPVAKAMAT